MNIKGSVTQWNITVLEAIILASGAIGIVIWAMNTFQKKDDAEEVKKALQERVYRVELELSSIRKDTSDISRDVSYIRGRLEPQSRNK